MAEHIGVELNGPYKPSRITTAEALVTLQRVARIPDDVELMLTVAPYSPEIILAGFACSYAPLFEDCGVMFPIPKVLLETLEMLQLAFPQMGPGFARHMIGLMVRCGETGDVMSPELALSMYSFKHNSIAERREIFYVMPHKERCIVGDLPGRDPYWQERYFFFRISPASVGYFDFGRLPPEWRSVADLNVALQAACSQGVLMEKRIATEIPELLKNISVLEDEKLEQVRHRHNAERLCESLTAEAESYSALIFTFLYERVEINETL